MLLSRADKHSFKVWDAALSGAEDFPGNFPYICTRVGWGGPMKITFLILMVSYGFYSNEGNKNQKLLSNLLLCDAYE